MVLKLFQITCAHRLLLLIETGHFERSQTRVFLVTLAIRVRFPNVSCQIRNYRIKCLTFRVIDRASSMVLAKVPAYIIIGDLAVLAPQLHIVQVVKV